jgi:hypothetical protein
MRLAQHAGAVSMIAGRPLALLSPRKLRLRTGAVGPATARRVSPASRSSHASSATVAFFTTIVILVVTCGWLFHDRSPVTPKSGLGYALGIGGGVTMLLLVVYSARKRLRFMRNWGPLSHSFRIHMILGVLGPVLILFHCNFHLGAPNSNVALASMLVVAMSGVVGRYIYTRISHGLYGARATFEELHAQLDVSAHTLGEQLPPASRAAQRLAAFAASARGPHGSIGGRLFRLVALPLFATWVHRRALHDLRTDLDGKEARDGWDTGTRRASEEATREMITAYIAALVKEVQFSAYERLFSLWHALHIPLFVMLLLTGVLHVVAVHMY